MMKFASCLLLAVPLLAVAAPDNVLSESVQTTRYAAAVTQNSITVGEAWEGYKVVKLADGSCQKVVHSGLKIEKAGDAQKATFKESKLSVTCPA
ncbi:hypothetical protein [Burkholderia ubonensis]|uniref:hypothetical protein n=1 Tax=Burkholderia ubonensis TaxID=101571 RepID=UPI0012FB2E84|nr:hypothetical protein [Burkholderia ubonensis]